MIHHPLFRHAGRLFTFRQWVAIVLSSLLLAIGSGLYLAVGLGFQLSEPWASVYDRGELFLRDTVRLTFQDRDVLPASRRLDETVFMAPLGILEQNKQFNWLADVLLPSAAAASSAAPTVASGASGLPALPSGLARVKTPSRLLESDWQPDFKGQ
jgi:hypothetical protein